jgi:conserved domain protein
MKTEQLYMPQYSKPLRKTFLMDKNYQKELARHKREYIIRFILFLIGLALCVSLSGCAAKPAMVRTEYKDVLVPIKCKVSLPAKPKFDSSNMQSAVELAKYYQTCEALLKECVDVGDR